jgi:uncharacterized protein (DUF2236 family)
MEDGLFAEDAVIRRVAGEGLLLAGGGRATLLQIAHPGVAHGVFEHSTFAERPLDRLRSTLTYAYGVLFGTRAEARSVSRAVRAMHGRVTGADDPALLVWVNATLYDTALLLHQRAFGPLPPAEADECYRQYSVLATSIGCPPEAWPADREAFARYLSGMLASIRVSEEARQIAGALLRPRHFPTALRPALPLTRFLTVGLLPEPIRAGYGYSWTPRRQRRLDRALDVTATLYPRLPARVRHWPKDRYLADLRRRHPLATAR